MLDPDPAGRVPPTHTPAPGGGLAAAGPHALQILSTEHWSLLSARSLGYTEAMSRASIFVAALTGAVVALALVGQATDFGDEFVAFAVVLLPVVFFIGLTTIARLGQVNREDAVWVQGMNRIRHAYLELAPELEPYFVTSSHDDDRGVLRSSLAVDGLMFQYQGFVALPGVIAVLDSVVAGCVAGIATLGLGGGVGLAIVLGAVAFGLTLVGFVAYAVRTVNAHHASMTVRFPSPPAG